MNSKDVEKKKKEVAECEPVAEAINAESGTDYIAKPHDVEPADVILESASGSYPNRMVQVVSIPHDSQIRAESGNAGQFKASLEQALKQLDVRHCCVGFTPCENLARRGVPRAQVDHLADRIRDISAHLNEGTYEIGHMEMLAFDPELMAYLSNVVLFRDDHCEGVTVDAPGVVAELPDDGSWIDQGIKLKLKKYGSAGAVKELALVIGVEALVDNQQVKAFMAEHAPGDLPFAEIWINSAEGLYCLKSRK